MASHCLTLGYWFYIFLAVTVAIAVVSLPLFLLALLSCFRTLKIYQVSTLQPFLELSVPYSWCARNSVKQPPATRPSSLAPSPTGVAFQCIRSFSSSPTAGSIWCSEQERYSLRAIPASRGRLPFARAPCSRQRKLREPSWSCMHPPLKQWSDFPF
jgi:hypothetical protein